MNVPRIDQNFKPKVPLLLTIFRAAKNPPPHTTTILFIASACPLVASPKAHIHKKCSPYNSMASIKFTALVAGYLPKLNFQPAVSSISSKLIEIRCPGFGPCGVTSIPVTTCSGAYINPTSIALPFGIFFSKPKV